MRKKSSYYAKTQSQFIKITEDSFCLSADHKLILIQILQAVGGFIGKLPSDWTPSTARYDVKITSSGPYFILSKYKMAGNSTL